MNTEEMKKIGFQSCVNTIGKNFYEKYKNSSVFSCGDTDDGFLCFLGINTKMKDSTNICLSTSMEDWEYFASCYVKDGIAIQYKSRTPNI